MLEKMDWMLIGMKNRIGKYLERLETEEDGSVMIEIVVLVVVIIIVAGIFKEQLRGVVEKVFSKLGTWIDSTNS